MSRSRPIRLNELGDTIVEVMVVLAVLGLAIGISYATANRSLLDARQAQENSIATELAQGQVETLRTMLTNKSTDNPDDYIFQSSPTPFTFCLDDTSGSPVVQTVLSPYPAGCEIDSLYQFQITYVQDDPTVTGGTFTVVATWPDVEGQGTDTVTLVYRLYQP